MFKKLGKHWLGSPHPKRECGTGNASVAHLQTRENLREKKRLVMARISDPSTVKIDRLPQVKYTCVDLGER